MTKYEIYLPLKYNDGTGIEPEKLKEIQQQLIAVFGALTASSLFAPFQGTWRYGGVEFVDDIIPDRQKHNRTNNRRDQSHQRIL
jgi:hypothetical protein